MLHRSDDPWHVRQSRLDLHHPAAAASVLTLSNGYLGVRAVPERPGHGLGPGTMLATVYEEVPHTYAERAYADPAVDEVLVPVVDAWALGWAVDGDPLDAALGDAAPGDAAPGDAAPGDGAAARDRHHDDRVLDLHRGVLDREQRWTAPSTGATVVLSTRRLVPLTRRGVVATRWRVRAESDLTLTARPVPGCAHAGAPPAHEPGVRTLTCRHDPEGSAVHQRAERSGREVVVRTAHEVTADDGATTRWSTDDPAGAVLTVDLRAGQTVEVVVLAAYAGGTDAAALHTRADAELRGARAAGWSGLRHEQEAELAGIWARGDVQVEGDDELQQAARYALFQVVQAAAQADGAGIRAKGLAGTGYHGHTFWDSECFVLPVLDHVLPRAAADHLRWRHATLPAARARAVELGLPGVTFPWRTISGRECSGYWPASTAAYHVNAGVGCAAARHVAATGDAVFDRDVAVDLLVPTARLWAGRGHHTPEGFRIDGVTGPDEYTAVVDNNAYTNLVARENLRAAADACERHPDVATRLGVTATERAEWRRAADRMLVPYSDELGVTEQHEGFTRHAPWDFGAAENTQYPLQEHHPFVELYRRQVTKQADLVLALHVAGDDIPVEQKRRDFAYYEAITVRDSSLSAPAQAVVAAEVGHPDLAYAYARECALIDLSDLRASTAEGLHVAALAGAWTALVVGLGGLRQRGDAVRLAPRLPRRLTRIAFTVLQAGARVEVDVRHDVVAYRLLSGAEARLDHHGEPVHLTTAAPEQERPQPPVEQHPSPPQPPHRHPVFDET
ncbi:family 65 glycosyl hydrolase [Cellulomonas sp. ACRRI]|uniref:glycoside hydrolase family 65 protein n=1 Tax=Cellulomonas sp. ACRRI TaxID=2918188 RepID=UPI001EF3455D|nr:glycosyl hydrolase family 65 protein [Cellulomonas sp. ACRRI]MCG7288105.1 family 65 glycosyl hydrolase [Cellulomonas sp. ACRRI]